MDGHIYHTNYEITKFQINLLNILNNNGLLWELSYRSLSSAGKIAGSAPRIINLVEFVQIMGNYVNFWEFWQVFELFKLLKLKKKVFQSGLQNYELGIGNSEMFPRILSF